MGFLFCKIAFNFAFDQFESVLIQLAIVTFFDDANRDALKSSHSTTQAILFSCKIHFFMSD